MLNKNSIFEDAAGILPQRIRSAVYSAADNFTGKIYEIRLYSNGAAAFTTDTGTLYVTPYGTLTSDVKCALCPTKYEIENTVLKAAGWSPFAHENEIKNGYITFGCGIRAGFGGRGNGTGSVRGITSINIRLPTAAELTGNAYSICNGIKNGLLIAGEPGSGKTTLLKKCAAGLAEHGKRVSVIDERYEFFGRDTSPPPNIDTVSGTDKGTGILRALRLLSPEYIICDEIGTGEESDAVKACLNSGVRFLASIHAGSIEQLVRRRQFLTLFAENVFDGVVFLDGAIPGKILREYSFKEIENAICCTYSDMRSDSAYRNGLCGENKEKSADLSAAVGVFA